MLLMSTRHRGCVKGLLKGQEMCKRQEMCEKPVLEKPDMLQYCLNRYKTQKIYERAVSEDPLAPYFVPHYTRQMREKKLTKQKK